MPDFNKYATKTPVQRPEQVTGLSQIVYPKYDYVNTFPPTAGLNSDGNTPPDPNNTKPFWTDDKQALDKMFGGVPVAPGGITDYNEAKRFNSDNIGFLAGRDNEDLYAQNQSFLSSVGHGLGRLAGLTVTKTGTGFGYLAGLVGIGNESEKYGHGFSAWIAGAGDNGMAKWFQNIEDDKIKNDWLPIYKKATEKDHGFFRHMGDLDFWTDDLTDGAAFMMSSFIPGMGVSKLKLGANVIKGLSGLAEIGRAEEAAALAEKGLQGTVESEALTKEGLGAAIETPTSKELGQTIKTGADATQQIPRAIKWIDNARLARGIDVGTVSVINTAAQAMFSANSAKENTYNTLINQKDEQGNNKYSVEQAKQVAAKVAKDSYVMNLGALSLMNLWEANFLFKKPGLANRFGPGNTFESTGIFGDAALSKKALGSRIYSAVKEPGKGVLTAGVWLGNMQLAIDRLNNNSDNFDLDFGDKLKLLGKQYVKQTVDLATGSDPEAAKALGVGSFMGAVAGKFLGPNEGKEAAKNLSNLNNQVNAFRELGNIYKTDADGKIDMSNGTPVIDEAKLQSFVASMNKVLSLKQIARSFEGKSVPELAKIYNDEVFAKFAKAHFDAGLSDLLHQKLGDISNISQEDLALLGFDPDSKNAETSQVLDTYTKKAKSLEALYDNIHNNFVPKDINLNTREGQAKYYDITDKMFYLSARSQSLSEIIKASTDKYEQVKANTDTYNQAFNSLSDDVVNQFNELFEKSYSAGKQPYIHPDLYGTSDDYSKFGERRDQYKADLEKFEKENIDVLSKMKKDARGRYMYEVANKNLLPSAKEMERQQIIQAESTLSRNATMEVLSRLADPKFGVKYYDDVYSKEMERQAAEAGLYNDLGEDVVDPGAKATKDFYTDPTKDINSRKSTVTDEEIKTAYDQAVDEGKVEDKAKIADHIAEKISKGEELTDHEQVIRKTLAEDVENSLRKKAKESDLNESYDTINELEKERDVLESKEDRTADEETELENLNKQIEALNTTVDTKYEQMNIENKVNSSNNIQSQDKSKYTEILNKIAVQKKRIVKHDDYYEVDGNRYRKVTDLIGDTISPSERSDPKTQAAVNAGNTIDTLAKAYFSGGLNEEFKNSIADKIGEDAYNGVVKSLDKLKADLEKQGIEILGSNVFVTDDALKVAGEIDVLGVDKNGNFKVYEIQARRGDIYRTYGKRGLGVKLRDIDGKRLSMYRNMFANQYGAIPDEIAIKFPFDVKYDRNGPSGFIEAAKIREEIRFKPLKNVEIKLKNGEPLKIGSKFTSVDMTKIFLDSFLPSKEAGDKLKYLFRNVPLKDLMKGIKLTVRQALPEFQVKYESQQKALAGIPGDYKITKFKDYRNKDASGAPKEFSNLYALVGNTEIQMTYDGTPVGFLAPAQTLAYKDINGGFKILDENTDAKTYAEVTGNSLESYNEFKRVATAYKKLHTELTNRMLDSPNKEVSLQGDELDKLIDFHPSVGELDILPRDAKRPDLKDLSFSGVRLGDKSIPTVANIDAGGNVKILMDKARKNAKLVSKYQEVDRWVSNNPEKVKAAMFDKNGSKVTDNVAVVETPSGDFKIVALKTKGDFNPADYDDFVDDLGGKFTAATSKNVFKNENVMVIPKDTNESINIGLKDHEVVSQVYPTEDIDTLEKFSNPAPASVAGSHEAKIDDFLANADEQIMSDLEDFGLTTRDAIMNDFKQGEWESLDDYLDNLKNCK